MRLASRSFNSDVVIALNATKSLPGSSVGNAFDLWRLHHVYPGFSQLLGRAIRAQLIHHLRSVQGDSHLMAKIK